MKMVKLGGFFLFNGSFAPLLMSICPPVGMMHQNKNEEGERHGQ